MSFKRAIIQVVLGVTCIVAARAQDPENFPGWDAAVIEKANTASGAKYLSEDERMVIFFANLVRADGPLFARTVLSEYMSLKDIEQNEYTRTLVSDLQEIKDLPMLMPERDLYEESREYAIWSGKKGYEGHRKFKSRFAPLLKKYNEVGENIYYGPYTPFEIIAQLLIDEGVPDLGHRKNLLNPRFNSVGVAIKPHKEYEYNCVMGFGLIPRTYQDYIE